MSFLIDDIKFCSHRGCHLHVTHPCEGCGRILGRKQVIAIIGGSFNPIHNGHIELGKYILNYHLADRVLYMPCYDHAFGKKLLPGNIRIDMIIQAIGTYIDMFPFPFEINNGYHCNTYNTITKLYEQYQDSPYIFKFVLGLDCALYIQNWNDWEELINLIPFIVFSRKGYTTDHNQWFNKDPHFYVFEEDFDIPDISSSNIKNLIKYYYRDEVEESIILENIDRNVFEYIKQNELYKED
ncbi:MAG: nicotinate-nicotinamide nucleotide adenylyltransferase [bacterium]